MILYDVTVLNSIFHTCSKEHITLSIAEEITIFLNVHFSCMNY